MIEWYNIVLVMPMEEMKRCTKCGQILKISEFYSRGDGHLHSYCKQCMRDYAVEYNRNNPQKIREYRRRLNAKRKKDRDSKRNAVTTREVESHYLSHNRCYLRKARALMAGKVIDPACGDGE